MFRASLQNFIWTSSFCAEISILQKLSSCSSVPANFPKHRSTTVRPTMDFFLTFSQCGLLIGLEYFTLYRSKSLLRTARWSRSYAAFCETRYSCGSRGWKKWKLNKNFSRSSRITFIDWSIFARTCRQLTWILVETIDFFPFGKSKKKSPNDFRSTPIFN